MKSWLALVFPYNFGSKLRNHEVSIDTAGFSKNGVLGIPYVGNMDISDAEVFGGRPSPASAGHAFDEGGGV